MIYTGSKALAYLTIPLFTIFKNLTIILIAYSELYLFNGSPVDRLTLTSFIMMVLSSFIAGWSDIAQGHLLKDHQVSIVVSYGWMIANCLSSAAFAVFMRGRMKEVGFKDFDTVYYNNLLAVPILIFASLLTESSKWSELRERYSEGGDMEGKGYGLMWGILLSSIMSFGISYSSSWCVRVTSSTTYR